MLHRSIVVLVSVLVLGPALSALAGLDPDLVAWLPMDEGSGTVAYDGSGNGNDGAIEGNVTWADGYLDGALNFGGSDSGVRMPHIAFDSQSFTIAMWINPVLSGSAVLFGQAQSGSTDQSMHFRMGGPSSTDAPVRGVRMGFYSNDLDSPTDIFQDNTWYHVAFWYDYENQNRRIYVDGEIVAEAGATEYLGTTGDTTIGLWETDSSQRYTGLVDDVQIYHRALSDPEVAKIMNGLMDMSLAQDASPAAGATDVSRDVVLSWTAGEFAATHDVYVGTNYDDVANATRSNPLGVLVSQGQTAATYAPAEVLEFGQTYYWRVDEVNAAPDNTIYTGEVWSFAVEPYAYPIENIVATTNGITSEGTSLDNTINGSGLNADDQHSIEATDMWLASAGTEPLTIEYTFDRVYKLDEMMVWNYNVQFELMLGFGLKDVTVEYSENGTDWTVLGDFEFAQATAKASYTANTIVDFDGAAVKAVRLTVNSGWGVLGQYGLSEVRFMYVPAFAREPQPANDTADVSVDTSLDWRAGREAVVHDVYFGADNAAVADGTALLATTDTTTYQPAGLEFGSIYYWKVDEVNEADAITTWGGDLWTFATQEFALIEGFESYDDEDNRIYDTWLDGYVNDTGSTVGYLEAPFAEKLIVNGGNQSLPLSYDNSVAPYYSETSRDFGSADWTASGADTLLVNFRGRAATFAELADGSILMGAGGADIWGTSDEFRFAYKELSGDGSITARVESVFNSNGWAKAGVMIRQNVKPTAANAGVFVTPGNGISFQYRSTAGGDSANTAVSGLTAPYWVKLTRTGDVFSTAYSADGVTWTNLETTSAVEVGMTGTVYIGLAVTSHDSSIMTNAVFSNVSTTGSISGDWTVEAVGVDQPGNDAEPLYVTVTDASGNAATVTNPDAQAALATSWTAWQIPYSAFTGVNMAGVQTLAIGLGNPDSPSAGGTGLIYLDDIKYGRPGLFTDLGDGRAVVWASGADIWGTSDEFRFAYRELAGDGEIIARVDSLVNTNAWAKAGVMIRQDEQTDAANAGIFVTPSNGISFQYRTTAGGSSGNIAEAGLVAPYWVKLTRTGDIFTAQYSADGITWTDLAPESPVEVPMTGTVYIGLAVTSHDAALTTGAEFSGIATSGAVTGDWQVEPVGL